MSLVRPLFGGLLASLLLFSAARAQDIIRQELRFSDGLTPFHGTLGEDDRLGASLALTADLDGDGIDDLVDVCPDPNQRMLLTLSDADGNERTYTVPVGWTEAVALDGPPGIRTLDLRTLDSQPGFLSTATVVESPGFDPRRTVSLSVSLGGSGALDNLRYDPRPEHDDSRGNSPHARAR